MTQFENLKMWQFENIGRGCFQFSNFQIPKFSN